MVDQDQLVSQVGLNPKRLPALHEVSWSRRDNRINLSSRILAVTFFSKSNNRRKKSGVEKMDLNTEFTRKALNFSLFWYAQNLRGCYPLCSTFQRERQAKRVNGNKFTQRKSERNRTPW